MEQFMMDKAILNRLITFGEKNILHIHFRSLEKEAKDAGYTFEIVKPRDCWFEIANDGYAAINGWEKLCTGMERSTIEFIFSGISYRIGRTFSYNTTEYFIIATIHK